LLTTALSGAGFFLAIALDYQRKTWSMRAEARLPKRFRPELVACALARTTSLARASRDSSRWRPASGARRSCTASPIAAVTTRSTQLRVGARQSPADQLEDVALYPCDSAKHRDRHASTSRICGREPGVTRCSCRPV